MNSRRNRYVLASIAASLGLAAVACGPSFIAPDVTPDLVQIGQSQWTGTTQASLEEGRELFVTHCHRCHVLPTPKSRTVEKWHKIIIKMAKKAKLDDAQRDTVLRFILAVRDLPAPAPTTAQAPAPAAAPY
jgi:hypothetical protein